jgi:1,4-alpha-glucan branching enzyme
MFGDYDGKFPQARLLYLYMYAHPGKKLLFMGSELGQLREWTEEQEQDWNILAYPIHDAFFHYMQTLSRLYLSEPALYRHDYEQEGFRWIDCHQEERCIYAIERSDGTNRLVILLHMADNGTQTYHFTLEHCKRLIPLLHTEWERFHGTIPEDHTPILGDQTRTGTQFTLTLPPFSGILLKVE